jgi:hypothetical protein
MCFAVGMLGCLLCVVLGAALILVRYEPQWYRNAGIPAGTQRTQLSQDFHEAFSQLMYQVGNEPEWNGRVTAKQVNAWFEEGMYQEKLDADLLRGNISQPRIAFEDNRVRLGFRYGKGIRSTVISMNLQIWVPPDDTSAVVLQLESLQAGLLPVSAQSVLEEISRLLREKDIEINWYRHNGYPTAVLRFQANQQHSGVELTAIQAKEETAEGGGKDGVLVIHGRNNDPALNPVPVAAPVGNQ